MNHRKTHFVFYLLILFSCLNYNPSHAQNNRSAAQKLYQKALVAFDEQQYEKCIPLLEKSMQTDPNFSNFLYDHEKQRVNLIDFGAARHFPKSFVEGYLKLGWAAANKDVSTIASVSKNLGFLTGDETQEMLSAHVNAGLVVGEPFLSNEPFDFAGSKLPARLGQYSGTFMKHRLTPPPPEVYALHRKLAGAFLLCIKLKAVIPCRDILENVFRSFEFSR